MCMYSSEDRCFAFTLESYICGNTATRQQRCDSSCGLPRLLPHKMQVQPFLRPECGIWGRGARLHEGQNASTSGTRREGRSRFADKTWICMDLCSCMDTSSSLCSSSHLYFFAHLLCKGIPSDMYAPTSHSESRITRLTRIFPVLLPNHRQRCASLTWVTPSCPEELGWQRGKNWWFVSWRNSERPKWLQDQRVSVLPPYWLLIDCKLIILEPFWSEPRYPKVLKVQLL